MATPLFDNIFEAEDVRGRPVPNGRVYTYKPGTTTPKVTYSDEAGTIPNTNPVILNSSGKAQIYGNGEYTINVENMFGGQVEGWPKNIWPKVISGGVTLKVNTIDDLRNTPGTYQDEPRDVLGYYDPGDGGGGPTRIWNEGQTPGFYVDNGGSIIVPGDGSAAWVWGEIGETHASWWGATTASESTVSIQTAMDDPSSLVLDEVYPVGSITIKGQRKKVIRGNGGLDFKHTSGVGLAVGFDVATGGIKGFDVEERLELKDSAGNASIILQYLGGPTGQSPSQTISFVTLKNVDITEIGAGATTIQLDNISQGSFISITTPFNSPAAIGLELKNSVNINTGVFSFIDCNIYGVIPLKINAISQLMDSFHFMGGYFATTNFNPTVFSPCVYITGGQITGLKMSSCHLEGQPNLSETLVYCNATLGGSSFDALHMSADGAKHAFVFEDAEVHGVSITNIEPQGLATRTNGGSVVYVHNDCVFDPAEPVIVGPFYRNLSAPPNVEIEVGGNFETISRAIIPQGLSSGFDTGCGPDTLHFMTDGDTTPSVINVKTLGSVGTTAIDNFDGVPDGHILTFIARTNITLNDDFFKLRLGANIPMTVNQSIKLLRTGEHWEQIKELS